MTRSLPRSARRSAGQRLFAVLVLVGYWSATIGLPVPQTPSKADGGGAAFPCQGHHCGCQDADSCWRTCCCYTATEKVAWASARGVEAPPSAVAAADAEWNAPRQRDRDKPSAACARCAERQAEAECVGQSCSAQSSVNDTTPTSTEEPASTTWRLSVSPVKCRALISVWVQNGSICPPTPVVCWSPCWECFGWVSPIEHTFDQLRYSPPSPPPRV